MNPKIFFGELKRRNVYKVAVAYAVVGWLLIQVATQGFPFLEIPTWMIRLVILLTALGFPVALIIAWAFELTPEGIKRTEVADAERHHSRGGVWIAVVVVAAVLSLGLFFIGRYTAPKVTRTSESLAKSIAVLPFENLSGDPDNVYFADGIQEEILTRLAKIADLKVISRTSTQRYQSKPENLPEIARQLGVAHILEGSVQKSGNAVRVNVQLIKAANDSNLWADTFDRKLTDIFLVESEVAKAIADQLRAKLTGQEEQVITAMPTYNVEAYDAYLRGLAYTLKTLPTSANALGAQRYFKEAVLLDPKFALAWAQLSIVDSLGYCTQSLQP